MPLEKTDGKQVGRFRPGQSGNPSGRPRGARNATTIAVESLLDGQAEKLTQKAIQMALEGDLMALRICLERICPPKKGHPVSFPMRPICTARDAADALADVAAAVATGKITPADGDAVSSILARTSKALEVANDGDGAKPIEQCLDEELYRIIAREKDRAAAPNLLTRARG